MHVCDSRKGSVTKDSTNICRETRRWLCTAVKHEQTVETDMMTYISLFFFLVPWRPPVEGKRIPPSHALYLVSRTPHPPLSNQMTIKSWHWLEFPKTAGLSSIEERLWIWWRGGNRRLLKRLRGSAGFTTTKWDTALTRSRSLALIV